MYDDANAGDLIAKLETRLGRLHARQRLGLEAEYEHHIFQRGRHVFHVENWYSIHGLIRAALKLSGLYWLGRRNATRLALRHNTIRLEDLPPAFEGYRLLHITDMHVDTNPRAMDRLIEIVRDLDYDLCVLTGDYRGRTYGPYEAALEGMARIVTHLKNPVYAVLGNHDSIRMVPGARGDGHPDAAERGRDPDARRPASPPRRDRRRAFLPCRQYREGGLRDPP